MIDLREHEREIVEAIHKVLPDAKVRVSAYSVTINDKYRAVLDGSGGWHSIRKSRKGEWWMKGSEFVSPSLAIEDAVRDILLNKVGESMMNLGKVIDQ